MDQPLHTNEDLLGPADLMAGGPLEYAPPRREVTHVVLLPPDPARMIEKAKKLVTQNKIRQSFHQLAENNIDAVQSWLHDVAKDSPAKAVELYIELAKFCLPQLRETAMTVTQNNVTRTYQSSADILQELNREA